MLEAYENEKGAVSIKIKLSDSGMFGMKAQQSNIISLPLAVPNLQKSKSFTPTQNAKQVAKKKSNLAKRPFIN